MTMWERAVKYHTDVPAWLTIARCALEEVLTTNKYQMNPYTGKPWTQRTRCKHIELVCLDALNILGRAGRRT